MGEIIRGRKIQTCNSSGYIRHEKVSTYRHAEVRLKETECHVDLETRQVNLIGEAPTTQHMVRPATQDTTWYMPGTARDIPV